MDRLEAALTTFIQRIDESIAALRRCIPQTDANTAPLQRFTPHTRHDEEFRNWRYQSAKQWGEIAIKMGSFVQLIVAPNIQEIARQILGTEGESDELMAARHVRVGHPQDPSRMREFDYVYATRRGWIIVDSIDDPKLRHIDAFREALGEANEYFPEYASLVLRPIFASLSIPDDVVAYCTRHHIYAFGLGPETMELLNLAPLSAAVPPAS